MIFVYEKNNKVNITFKDNKPVEFPEYTIAFDENKNLVINDEIFNPIEFTKLDSDLVNSATVELTSELVVDLNGHTISCPNNPDGVAVYKVQEGGKLTINGDGTIDGVSNNDYNIAVWARGGDITINGGYFTNKGADSENDPTHFDLIYASAGGVVEINGGTFDAQTPKWTLNNLDSNPGKFIVKGGTFIDYDPSNSQTEPEGAPNNFVADGYKVIQEGNVYTVVKA